MNTTSFSSNCGPLMALASGTLFASLLLRHEGIALASLTLVLWIGLEWLACQRLMLSSRSAIREVSRSIDQQTDESVVLCTDREYVVQTSVRVPKSLTGFRVRMQDSPPDACQLTEGQNEVFANPKPGQDLTCSYAFQTGACGNMIFPGINIQILDGNGFFAQNQFLPCEQKLTVLPFLIRPQSTVSVIKRNNVQRLLGHHRHRRPGMSAELLGIRDYQPGDPPRTIAWKPTARLGRLMTREFESEVPIRATLVVDLSAYQFNGRPAAAVADRVISASASIASLLLSDRDPVAAILFQKKVQRVFRMERAIAK